MIAARRCFERGNFPARRPAAHGTGPHAPCVRLLGQPGPRGLFSGLRESAAAPSCGGPCAKLFKFAGATRAGMETSILTAPGGFKK